MFLETLQPEARRLATDRNIANVLPISETITLSLYPGHSHDDSESIAGLTLIVEVQDVSARPSLGMRLLWCLAEQPEAIPSVTRKKRVVQSALDNLKPIHAATLPGEQGMLYLPAGISCRTCWAP